MQTAGFAMAKGLSFSVYGENLIIMVQNYMVIGMIWYYNEKFNWSEGVIMTVVFVWFGYVLFVPGQLSMEMLENFLSANIIFSKCEFIDLFADIGSRIPQIYTNCAEQSTGQLAFLTVFLQWAGGLARVITVLFESDDWMFKLQYLIGLSLNTMVFMQFFMFGSGPPKGKKVKAKDD